MVNKVAISRSHKLRGIKVIFSFDNLIFSFFLLSFSHWKIFFFGQTNSPKHKNDKFTIKVKRRKALFILQLNKKKHTFTLKHTENQRGEKFK